MLDQNEAWQHLMDANSHQHYVPLVMPQDIKYPRMTSSSHQQYDPHSAPAGRVFSVSYKPSKMKKAARDPGAPKRNLSAYLLYQNSMREQFKALNPGMSFGQLSKYTSAMYAQLNPDEKVEWQGRAEADKLRYELELGNYSPPPGYDQRGEQIIIVPKHKKGKASKDSNAPKKNVSAYLLYQNAMREKFKGDNPGMSFGQLSKYTSHMYKNLTPEEKMEWDQIAHQDKERYVTEIASYDPPPGHDARGVMIEDEPHGGNRKRKRPKDPNAPKRNKGSFVLFAEEERPRIKQEYPDVKFTDMGIILGERWRALEKHQKERFEALANEDKNRFADEMENYNRQHGILAEQHSNYAAMIDGTIIDLPMDLYQNHANL